MNKDAAVFPLLRLYGNNSFWGRAFLRFRVGMIDLQIIDEAVGGAQRVLDLACGHGLLANYLFLSKPSRIVHGIDIDAERVAMARVAASRGTKATFSLGDIISGMPSGFDAITLIDTLHYFNPDDQKIILRNCFKSLQGGGTLILREAENDGSIKFHWNYAHEMIMTRLRITKTKEHSPRLYFGSREEIEEQLRSIGFSSIKISRSKTILPYTDTLYVCKRAPAESLVHGSVS